MGDCSFQSTPCGRLAQTGARHRTPHAARTPRPLRKASGAAMRLSPGAKRRGQPPSEARAGSTLTAVNRSRRPLRRPPAALDSFRSPCAPASKQRAGLGRAGADAATRCAPAASAVRRAEQVAGGGSRPHLRRTQHFPFFPLTLPRR